MMGSSDIPDTMSGVLLTGHGGLEKLEYRTDLVTPSPASGEVLIRVISTSVNNTDINTRIGWYSKSVTGATNMQAGSAPQSVEDDDASWSGVPLQFPRIQGADCFGEIVGVGDDVASSRVGETVLVRSLMRSPVNFRPFEIATFGSECDGGFAEYAVAPTADVFVLDKSRADRSLGAIPCAYSTAEGMLSRASICADDRVLILGASGGVGSAAVKLTKLRGAKVIAVAGAGKEDAVAAFGADRVIARGKSLTSELGPRSVTVIVDLVGGDGFTELPDLLTRGGRYVTAGAIAGPIVSFDLRTLYLNDQTFFGSTAQDEGVFENIIRYINDGFLVPEIAATFPLSEIHKAQEKFLEKSFVGKILLIP